MNLPNAFCWTKMGAEAGQPLDNILYRKEMERILGKGLFMWGVGNPLGQALWSLIERVGTPEIFFSEMKSKAKKIDSSPKKVVMWTSYIDSFSNIKPIPEHVLVTSRGNEGEISKQKHYALICHREQKINQENWKSINISGFKNINSDKEKIGYSQITAIIERKSMSLNDSMDYKIMFSANLVEPYFVKLINPIELSTQVLKELNKKLSAKEFKVPDWMQWVSSLKKTMISDDDCILTQKQNKFQFGNM